ncbi:MAG: LPS assembly lipoprotein LptE [Nitrospirota bacterium]
MRFPGFFSLRPCGWRFLSNLRGFPYHAGHVVAALAASILVIGCGYGLVSSRDGTGPTPVAVPLFDNRTFEPFLDARVTERVRSRVETMAAWKLVSAPESADLVIRGSVTGFGIITMSFDEAHRPLEQRVAVTAEVTATPRTGVPFQGTLTGTAEYRESADSLQTRAAKDRAIDEAADNVAHELTARLYTHLLAQDRAPSPPEAAPVAP